ncbi:hypothetical protein K437DRAFT_190448 [Tilletiaria anomala UBC 951]|uniref:Uncharacterized protein n=1 Tax=Tilletiaria anomala (strain ATCC 24038 / CBS 436.72 / UBC 951) TaxID=1037660 RepID=A0A066VF71_TILAU|nr:uncharacterized protein K437DRAFT_190448 [Tilletiaria anomala UBC 951]KDN40357.1 hypothetical protein K437DRAFT_190448 [Tilletiaria anomala UBC 951]
MDNIRTASSFRSVVCIGRMAIFGFAAAAARVKETYRIAVPLDALLAFFHHRIVVGREDHHTSLQCNPWLCDKGARIYVGMSYRPSPFHSLSHLGSCLASMHPACHRRSARSLDAHVPIRSDQGASDTASHTRCLSGACHECAHMECPTTL